MRLSRLRSSCDTLTLVLLAVIVALGYLVVQQKQHADLQRLELQQLMSDLNQHKQNEAELQQEAMDTAVAKSKLKADLISCHTSLQQAETRLHANLKIETDFHKFDPKKDPIVLKLDDQPLLDPAKAEHDPPHLAILVPFRKADAELRQFVPHMDAYLKTKGIPYSIHILNQVDTYRFNRGLLLDAGFLLVEDDCDYIALHDVDLLPINNDLDYGFPSYPYHVSAPWLHPTYSYKTFIGGILLMAKQHFRLINGMSINYWGWGREDDELYKRIIETGLKVDRPPLDVGTKSNTFIHLHDAEARPRDMMQVGKQLKQGKARDPTTGVHVAKDHYTVISKRQEKLNGVAYTVYDLDLKCDLSITPWCEVPKECEKGYFRKPIKDDPNHGWMCRKCGTKCWKGFVLVGECTQTASPVCLKVGRDISEEEAAKWPAGQIIPPQGG